MESVGNASQQTSRTFILQLKKPKESTLGIFYNCLCHPYPILIEAE